MAKSDERKGVISDWSIEEAKVLGPNVLMSSEQSLHEEVIQSALDSEMRTLFK